jgi:hypothetical protein
MTDVPVAAQVVLYAAGVCVFFALLYVVVRAAASSALRPVVAELHAQNATTHRLLEQIGTSAAYLADVADAWADAEADRRGLP